MLIYISKNLEIISCHDNRLLEFKNRKFATRLNGLEINKNNNCAVIQIESVSLQLFVIPNFSNNLKYLSSNKSKNIHHHCALPNI